MRKRGGHFLKEVTNHIQSKEAKRFVAAELEFHLKKAKNNWMEKGLSEIDAEDKAVQQMGSPMKLGQELNKLHRPRVDWLIIILLAAAMALGFLPVVPLGDTSFMDVNYFLKNKIIFVILGVAAALGTMLVDYRKLEKLGWLFYIIGVLTLLAISLFPNIMVNGKPFIKIGPITIESLMAVPFFFLAWASFFNNSRLKIWHFAGLFLISLYLFLSIPTLSTTFIYLIMVFVMLWWSKLSTKKIIVITIVPICFSIIGGFYFLPFVQEYQMQRFLGFLNRNNDAYGAGYMYIRLKELMSSAGWFGTSEQIEFQDAPTDLVFASLTYYYGYWFALILVLILSLLVVRIMIISYQINSHYSKLLLVGGMTLFAVQFIYHVGMILGLLPITSMSLPFISYGLMPTLFHAFLMGIALSVYRRKNLISSSSI